ncbi:hypothetical protein GCM10007913_32430 [Devosia yakushimensis]|uniref:Alpha 1,4-glycosyltransferase domain-containing protein n=1 Tax=Devosia yakushimensis TaxID=470028 RepID=A0ABQ5UH69_9HYPH|nr:hypothetical protein [Devosia yakushimensis]GLQ11311.1 hypothetical protein GCM10007913_32430 [Devosia yakushimensis]
MSLPTIVSFWHGPMSWLEALSIASFRRHGHRVEVYSFDPVPGLPDGAVAMDAAEILPRDKLVFYKGKGTPGVFSDYFRMSLLRQGRGVYADLDVYCVRPIEGPPDYLMAYERPGSVNGAVLHIPADAPLLDDLLAIFTDTRRPLLEPHLPPLRRLEVAARRMFGEKIAPEDMQYGATGPFALTYYVRRRGLQQLVRSSEVLYPIPYEGIPELMQAGSSIDKAITPETLAVHIWRSQLTRRGRADMPLPAPGSALAELCAREGIVLG